MRKDTSRVALAGAIALLLCARGPALAQYPRKTAVVQAVEKTRHGIITLKVTRSGDWGRSTISGTGVIVDERGFAITNHHVVRDADKVVVTFADKSTCEARVHVEEPGQDLGFRRFELLRSLECILDNESLQKIDVALKASGSLVQPGRFRAILYPGNILCSPGIDPERDQAQA